MSYFNNVVGQERIKSHINQMIQEGTLPHSMLLYGEEGLGKMTMAKAIASTLLNREVFSKEIEPGEKIYIDRGEVFWLRPMKKSGLSIDQWQTLLKDHLSQTSAGIRLVIIEDFQTARADFANAILKSIEEPPEQVYFLIITTKKQLVLPTILSRCMLLPFVETTIDSLVKKLQEDGFGEKAQEAAILSQGNYGRAKNILNLDTNESLQKALQIMEILVNEDNSFTKSMLSLHSCERGELEQVFYWMRLIARDMMVLKFNTKEELLKFPNLKYRLKQNLQAWNINALQTIFDETIKAERSLRLHIRTMLVVNAVIIALQKALKE